MWLQTSQHYYYNSTCASRWYMYMHSGFNVEALLPFLGAGTEQCIMVNVEPCQFD